MNSLYHYGIKGMKWGVRNGPPYPLGAERKSISENAANPQTVAKARKFVNASTIRNVAVGAVAGALIVAGTAYVIKNRGLLSKTRVSDLGKTGKRLVIEFMTYDDAKPRSGELEVFTPLSIQAAQNRYRDNLANIDKILYPDGGKSLLDINVKAENATYEISRGIGSRMRQASLSDDLVQFAKVISGGRLNLNVLMSVRDLVFAIDKDSALFEQAIKSADDFGDLKPKEAQEVLEIVKNLAEIYRNDR